MVRTDFWEARMVARYETAAKANVEGPVRVTVSFDADDYGHLKVIAKSKRVSLAWVVRDAVTDYLDARGPLFARKRGTEAT